MGILYGSIGLFVIAVIKDIDRDNGILKCPAEIMFSLLPSTGFLCFKQALVKVQTSTCEDSREMQNGCVKKC